MKQELLELLKDKEVREALKNAVNDLEDWPQYAYVEPKS